MKNEPQPLLISLVVIPAMIIPFIGSLFYFVIFSEHDFAKLFYGATKIFTLIWPLLAVTLILQRRIPKITFTLTAIPLGIATGLIIVIIAFGLMQTPLGDLIENHSDVIKNHANNLGVLTHFWTFTLFISIFHSLLEEYYWRWFVFGHLKEIINTWLAHLLAGAAFAAHHIVVATQFFPGTWGFILGGLVGLGGIIWSLMYLKQQTLLGAWISHMIVDFGLMAIGYQLLFLSN